MLYSRTYNASHTHVYRQPRLPLHEHACVMEIGYNRMAAGRTYRLTRDVYILHYVVSGKGMYMGQPFAAGDCYYVVPGETEVVEADREDPYGCYWIVLCGEKVRPLMEKAGFSEHNAVFPVEDVEQYGEILGACLSREAYTNELTEACGMEEAFYRVMARHFADHIDTTQGGDSRAREIAKYINRNCSSPLKVGDLCEVFFLSKNHLCTVFKREYGVTPQEYLINCRIERAKQLLQQPHISVAETALSVGIDNPLYFSRCFHQRVGMSPTEYRKSTEADKKPGQER